MTQSNNVHLLEESTKKKSKFQAAYDKVFVEAFNKNTEASVSDFASRQPNFLVPNFCVKQFKIYKSIIHLSVRFLLNSDIELNSLKTRCEFILLNEKTQIETSIGYLSRIDEQSYGIEGNLNTIAGNEPLQEGIYAAFIRIHFQCIADETPSFVLIPLGNAVEKIVSSKVIETELYYYTGVKQLKYKVVYGYSAEFETLEIINKKLLEINPSRAYGDIKNKQRQSFLITIIYRIFLKLGYPILYKLISILPLKENRVFFASDSREEMGGNFEFLNKELIRQGYNDIHWVFKENPFVPKSLREFVKFAWLTATSEFIFIEEKHDMLESIKPKKQTELIQTWHAAGAFKVFGFSRLGMPGGLKARSKAYRNYTRVTVSSKAMVPIYTEAFNIDTEKVEPLGLPRTDLFYDEELKNERVEQLKQQYSFLNSGKKVILFAPTFRGATRKSAHYPFEYLDLKRLYEELHEEYIFLLKLHFNVLNKITVPVLYSDFIYDLSDYRDVNDLFLVSDILITDYSSVAFEFALLNKPMLFFAFDLMEYVKTRGFYYDYEDLVPGKIVGNSMELVQAIKNNDYEFEKIEKFRDHFFTHQDGQASKRVVERFVKRLT